MKRHRTSADSPDKRWRSERYFVTAHWSEARSRLDGVWQRVRRERTPFSSAHVGSVIDTLSLDMTRPSLLRNFLRSLAVCADGESVQDVAFHFLRLWLSWLETVYGHEPDASDERIVRVFQHLGPMVAFVDAMTTSRPCVAPPMLRRVGDEAVRLVLSFLAHVPLEGEASEAFHVVTAEMTSLATDWETLPPYPVLLAIPSES